MSHESVETHGHQAILPIFLVCSYFRQVLMNYFWFGDDLQDAVSKPRLHSQLFPNMVLVEPNFPKKYIKGLKRYGHKHITDDTTLFTGEQNLCFSVLNTNNLLTER